MTMNSDIIRLLQYYVHDHDITRFLSTCSNLYALIQYVIFHDYHGPEKHFTRLNQCINRVENLYNYVYRSHDVCQKLILHDKVIKYQDKRWFEQFERNPSVIKHKTYAKSMLLPSLLHTLYVAIHHDHNRVNQIWICESKQLQHVSLYFDKHIHLLFHVNDKFILRKRQVTGLTNRLLLEITLPKTLKSLSIQSPLSTLSLQLAHLHTLQLHKIHHMKLSNFENLRVLKVQYLKHNTHWPSQLQALYVKKCSSTKYLPNTLKILHIKHIDSSIRGLPCALEQFKCKDKKLSIKCDWPSGLKSLNLKYFKPEYTFERLWPKTLTDIFLKYNIIEQDFTIHHLPKYLNTIKIVNKYQCLQTHIECPLPSTIQKIYIFDLQILNSYVWPNNLKELAINTFFGSMPKYLRVLDVSHAIIDHPFSEHLETFNAYSCDLSFPFPDSLKYLRIKLYDQPLSFPLPRHLIRLNLNKYTHAFTEPLPSTLKYLRLKSYNRQFRYNLPPTLTYIHLPQYHHSLTIQSSGNIEHVFIGYYNQ